MSNINLIIIKKDRITQTSLHFRKVIQLLKNKKATIPRKLSKTIDEGYLIMDFNKRTIINNQLAIHLNYRAIKDWNVINLVFT